MQQVYGLERHVQDVFLVLLFFLFLCHFLFNTKYTRIFLSACALGYLLFIQKLKEKWIYFFIHRVLDSVREKFKRVIRQLEKPEEALESP